MSVISGPLALFALFAIPSLVFQHTLLYPFTNLDDNFYIRDNANIKHLSWPNIWDTLSHSHFSHYMPLTFFSYTLDYHVWGLKPFGFRLSNLILHSANSALLFVFLKRIGVRAGSAFGVALLFAIHPVQLESFIWIAERKTILAAFFMLLGWIAHVEFRNHGTDETRSTRAWKNIRTAAFVAACLSKAIGFVFPFVLLAYDFFYLGRRSLKPLFKEYGFYFLVSFATAFLLVKAHADPVRPNYLPFGSRLGGWRMIPALVTRYLFLTVFPFRQSIYYELPTQGFSWLFQTAAGTVALIFLTCVFAVRKCRLEGPKLFWLAWYFIFLLPVLHLVPFPTTVQDRYLYFPVVAAGMFFFCFCPGPKYRRAVCAVLVFCYGAAAWQRSFVWANDGVLFSDALKKAPNDWRAWASMATVLADQGETEKTAMFFEKALKMPNAPKDDQYWAQVYYLKGEYEKASDVLNHTPPAGRDSDYFSKRGVLEAKMGQWDAALASLEEAVRLDPKSSSAHYQWAKILERRNGNFAKIENAYRTAIALDPDFKQAFVDLANFYVKNGFPEKGMGVAREYLKNHPGDSLGLQNNKNHPSN